MDNENKVQNSSAYSICNTIGIEIRQVNKKFAFTLAETLITLVIIGVVAALTIPNLIIKHSQDETVTRLKKAYSTLAQTTQLAISNNGPIETWTISESQTGGAAKEFFEKYLKPYLNIQRDCGLETTGACEYKVTTLNDNTPSVYDDRWYRFYLQDGSFVILLVGSDSSITYAYIGIDINGPQKPNRYGRDSFTFIYWIKSTVKAQNGKIIPYGEQYSVSDLLTKPNWSFCNKNAPAYAGEYCSTVIMKSNWTIPDGYPW